MLASSHPPAEKLQFPGSAGAAVCGKGTKGVAARWWEGVRQKHSGCLPGSAIRTDGKGPRRGRQASAQPGGIRASPVLSPLHSSLHAGNGVCRDLGPKRSPRQAHSGIKRGHRHARPVRLPGRPALFVERNLCSPALPSGGNGVQANLAMHGGPARGTA